jgi:mannose-6-phosphate isomerase
LPFLAKVLSVRKALSIQAHPSKANAKILNSTDSKNYPDINHKPEIAIALTDVELIHGWINEQDVAGISTQFPDLKNFLKKFGINLGTWNAATRKQIVSTLFSASGAEIAGLNNMILKSLVSKKEPNDKQSLFLKLAKQVQLDDVGLLLAMFLRHLKLSLGESMYTPAGEIHAYLSGDLFECMANSDNVIRAGLTQKFQDVAALIQYSNFEEGHCSISVPTQCKQNPDFLEYSSAASEFSILSVLNSDGPLNYIKFTEGPELIVVLEGNVSINFKNETLELKQGDALLIPASVRELSLRLRKASIFRALLP